MVGRVHDREGGVASCFVCLLCTYEISVLLQ